MEEKAKRGGVSRRDFLKGVGGGAISTAIISKDLLNPTPAEVYAQQVPSKPTRPKIPGGITPDDFKEIRDHLEKILKEARAQEVHLRLNETEEKKCAAPVFVGWVESDDLRKQREAKNHPDPGLYRFGDAVFSSIYVETFNKAKARVTVKQTLTIKNWNQPQVLREKRSEEKALAPKAGVMHQRCMGIIAEQDKVKRLVGTLNVGFANEPKATLTVDGVMEKWAGPKSGLVQYLQKFEFGGPQV